MLSLMVNNLIRVITHKCENHLVHKVVSTTEAPRGVENQSILLSVFHSSGKGFSKLKLAERALSISEQIISMRPFPSREAQRQPHDSWPIKARVFI